MATSFPTSLDTAGGTLRTDIASTTDMNASGFEHDELHVNVHGAALALEAKVGTGASTPVADAVFMGTGTGTSGWDTSPTFKGTVTLGVNDAGVDLLCYGATNGVYSLWDESADEWTFVGADLDMDDNAVIRLGTGDDLNIYADGNNSFIDHNGDGDLWIRANATGENIYINSATKILLQTQGVSKLDIELDGSLHIMPANTYPLELGEGHTKNLQGVLAYGYRAGLVNTGAWNIAIGFDAMGANTTGNLNTAVGNYALDGNVTGTHNTAMGHEALSHATNIASNVAVGFYAGKDTQSSNNVAIGAYALDDTNTGGTNTAVGYSTLGENENGAVNTALGYYAGSLNISGSHNVFIGYSAGRDTTTGGYNTIVGSQACDLMTGGENTAFGYEAGGVLSSGGANCLIGKRAGDTITTGGSQTMLGWHATGTTTGANNTILGYNSGPSSATVSNEFTLGNSSVATLRCNASLTGLSDGRDKAEIEDLDVGLDFVKRLRPRRWSWDMRDGGKVGIKDAGFVAQELQQAQIDEDATVPNLVYDSNPDRLESSSSTLIPVLVRAVQELSEKVEALA